MDVIIPGHAVRQFTAAIACLSKIGKDVYLEFDAISGLALRSLNDAKSAYACFHYTPAFFERCTAPPQQQQQNSRKRNRDRAANDEEDDEEEEDDNLRFSCRVALRALSAIVRPRKNVVSLRIRNSETTLNFNFQLQHKDTLLTVIHCVKFADAVGVSAVAPTDSASEIVASPKILLQLLEPLHRTAEAALIVRKSGSVSACSFHHTDTTTTSSSRKNTSTSSSSNNNAILQATSASLLKSETACGIDEFMEFDFVSTRDELDNDDDMPEEVNDEVILVFSIKEAKAMLQFCSSNNSNNNMGEELQVDVNFFWGGKPVVMEAATETFSAQLVLASLDYKLLTSMQTMGTTGGAGEPSETN